jgi:HD-GYP domain-containing protein (c-di-GMP phosphodiesterase class II)
MTSQETRGESLPAQPLPQRLRRWLIEPSPEIRETDRRRQATLLTGLLLSLIVVASLSEAATIFLIDWENYTGYRQTIVVVISLGIIYAISRTHRTELAAILAVVVASIAVFLAGLGEPRGVLGGLFDFLIVPLWLGSLFVGLRRLLILIAGSLGGLLVFPLLVHEVTLDDILIGPFTFILINSLLLIVITRHRDSLEEDRRAQLQSQERSSRHAAARAEALLRVAHRLNAQLDQEAVLEALGEEVAQALNTNAAVITLYDLHRDHFQAAAGVGLTGAALESIPALSKQDFDAAVKRLGPVFAMSDLQASPDSSFFIVFREMDLRSIAFATMQYESELIGSLCALTITDRREFTPDDLLLLQGLADQAALALVNTRLYKDAHRRLERLQALRAIDIAIITNRDIQKNLEVLLEQITDKLEVDAAVFLLLDEQRQQLDFAASRGFRTRALRYTRLSMGQGLAGRAALEQTIIRLDLRSDPQSLAYAPALGREGFETYFAAPLTSQGRLKGVLEVFHRSPLVPDEEWLNFLEALAGQAAIAIESTTLFDDLQRINSELTQAYDSTIEGWSHALDLRDRETEGHTQRVTRITLKLAQAMGLKTNELVHLRRGALLHDIGKMGVPDQILNKPGRLTAEEWGIMKKHPAYAFELLYPIVYLRPALDIPYSHHEKWDGSGYPRGLRGEKIPLAARIFAVVDVYDALTSDRPYRKAWTKEKTFDHIHRLAETHFDPQVVAAFLALKDELTTEMPVRPGSEEPQGGS